MMRLKEIALDREAAGSAMPICSDTDISAQIGDQFYLRFRESWRRKLMRATAWIPLGMLRPLVERRLGHPLSFHPDAICIDERFGEDRSIAALLTSLPHGGVDQMLVPGCYLGGEDVQFWLRRGVKRVDGIDLNSLAARWAELVPILERTFDATVHFQQAALEKLPFGDATFDLVVSRAVLEHVQNLEAVSAETARVLKTGGLAWHGFGPFYFSPGGDHCIDAYGPAHVYDHLLLSDAEYLARISDQGFFDGQPDPNLPFWARNKQFSFAFARDYLEVFRRHFHIRHVVAKISPLALAFRRDHRTRWQSLLDAGVHEEDLTLKGLSVVLQKR